MNDGTCSRLNSAGRWVPMRLNASRVVTPAAVRRNPRSADWSDSALGPWSQSITSASARIPETSYMPRTTTSSSSSSAIHASSAPDGWP